MKIFSGTGVGVKKASGIIHFYKEAKKARQNTFTTCENELKRLNKSIKDVKEFLEKMHKKALKEIGGEEAKIFEIHLMLLEDEDLREAIEYEIYREMCAENAVLFACEKYSAMLRDLDDEYLSEREKDIKDIGNQIINALENKEIEANIHTSPYILVAEDLTPSQTVMLDKDKILGFVTFFGTPNSHTAILARAMGIPALVGVGEIDYSFDGKFCLLDSEKGELIINPTECEIEIFKEKEKEESKIAKEHERYLKTLINKPAISKNGHRVLIYANIGSEKEAEGALLNGAEGIGLLRSEMLYLSLDRYPTENELYQAYKKAVTDMKGRRVIIRTLDIGADKQISYFNIPKEENPALGYRGVRICLDRADIFKTQLRAILRASAHGKASIMLPMIVSENEIKECRELLEECKNELFEENYAFDSKIELGIMIETPASAIMSDILAKHVDFFSVGTNDLTQYTLAVDRQNNKVAHIGEKNHEPILRLIKYAADQIHKKGGWIGICGELAADLNLTQCFVNMKIDELSVSSPYLLGIRKRVGECL